MRVRVPFLQLVIAALLGGLVVAAVPVSAEPTPRTVTGPDIYTRTIVKICPSGGGSCDFGFAQKWL